MDCSVPPRSYRTRKKLLIKVYSPAVANPFHNLTKWHVDIRSFDLSTSPQIFPKPSYSAYSTIRLLKPWSTKEFCSLPGELLAGRATSVTCCGSVLLGPFLLLLTNVSS